MCRAIRFELNCESPWSTYCHCESCRRHTGAPVASLVAGSPEYVTWLSGDRALYESSPRQVSRVLQRSWQFTKL